MKNINYGITMMPQQKFWKPKLLVQTTLWGDVEYVPITTRHLNEELLSKQTSTLTHEYTKVHASYKTSKLDKYLYKNLIPEGIRYEGREEIPCVEPYTIDLPSEIIGVDETTPHNAEKFGLHGFCDDRVLIHKLHNMHRVIQKAKKYHCAFGLNFSVPMDAPRCVAIEATRLNRTSTISLQRHGIQTIQTVSLSSARFFDFAFDGLAPNCPIAFENMCVIRDPQLKRLQRLSIEELIRRKSPTVLVVVGNHLGFDPQLPVVYYESRIQKFRRHGYRK